MRLVSETWLNAFPGPPFIVCTNISNSASTVWGLTRTGIFASAQHVLKLPSNSYCWGGSIEVVGLTSEPGSYKIHCLVCGNDERLPPLPNGYKPESLFIFQNHRLMRLLNVMGNSEVFMLFERALRLLVVGQDRVVHSLHLKDSWYFSVDSYCVVKCHMGTVTILQPGVPEIREGMISLKKNGHHMFDCNGNMYLCIILKEKADLLLKLFRAVEHEVEGEVTLSFVPDGDIGPFSVYLGANHPFVCPSNDIFVGRKQNTAYFEDWDGESRGSRVIGINFGSGEREIFKYPEDLSGPMEEWAPGVWVCPKLHQGISAGCRFCEH